MCFRCFEQWQTGHRCKGPTFNIIEDNVFYDTSEELNSEGSEQELIKTYEQADVSLCTMMGERV